MKFYLVMERAGRRMLFLTVLIIILEPEGVLVTDVVCFKCSGTGCDDPFNPEESEFCQGQACAKTTVNILGDLKTIRECLDKAPDEFKCATAKTEVVKASVCICGSVFCNQSKRIDYSFRLLLFLIFVSHMILSCP